MRPRLMVITDARVAWGELLLERVERVVALARPGSVLVQLRDRDVPIRERLALGRALRRLTRHHGQALAVNDRLDLARLLDADALHLGEHGVPVEDARRVWGGRFVSRACHDPEQAEPGGADAVVLSPILAPRKGAPALGVGGLAAARARVGTALLFALGGVDGAGARACLAAGADGVAAIGAAIDGRDPRPLVAAVGALGPA
jgi:thiamine-phosphate pyrophosphorylase